MGLRELGDKFWAENVISLQRRLNAVEYVACSEPNESLRCAQEALILEGLGAKFTRLV